MELYLLNVMHDVADPNIVEILIYETGIFGPLLLIAAVAGVIIKTKFFRKKK